MRFWSEGLGARQLVMNLGKSKIKRQDEVMLLSGVVDSPAPWEYEVKIQREDWATILDTASSKDACAFIATHTTLAQLLGMAVSIVSFVLLLAWFRIAWLLGFQGTSAAPKDAAAIAGSAQSGESKVVHDHR